MTNGSHFCGLEVFGLDLHFTARSWQWPCRGCVARPDGASAVRCGLFVSGAGLRHLPGPWCLCLPEVVQAGRRHGFTAVLAARLAAWPCWLERVGIRWLGAGNGFSVGEWLAALSAGGANLSFGGAPAQLEHATRRQRPGGPGEAARAG
jgi:hypothetical protein